MHELLGEFYETLDNQIDIVAERKVILSVAASGKIGSVAESVDFQDFRKALLMNGKFWMFYLQDQINQKL